MADKKYTFDFFTLSASLTENRLDAALHFHQQEAPEDLSWKFDLLLDGVPLEEGEIGREPTVSYQLKKSGNYLVRVYALYQGKGLPYLQKGLHYYTPELQQEYRVFLSSIEPAALPVQRLPLYCLSYPYQHMAVVFSSQPELIRRMDQAQSALKDLLPQFTAETVSPAASHSALGRLLQKQDAPVPDTRFLVLSEQGESGLPGFYLSGQANWKNKICHGGKELTPSSSPDSFSEASGIFTALQLVPDGIRFINDYFGLYRIYYYDQGGLSVAANSYHLLLLLLKALLSQTPTFAPEMPLPYLLFSRFGILEQRLSHHMDVIGVQMVPIDQELRITRQEGLCLAEKPLGKLLRAPLSKYKKLRRLQHKILIRQTVRDLKHNIQLVLDDPHYSDVLIDLTGGKDSRTVYAALTAVDPKHQEKVYVNYNDINTEKDRNTSVSLNQRTGNYPWNDLPQTMQLCSRAKKELRNRSYYLGSCFEAGYPWELSAVPEPHTRVRMIGGGGESMLRPYRSMHYPKLPYESDLDTLLDQFLNFFELSLFNLEKAKPVLRRELHETFSSLPGASLKEKFNLHFIYFRNSSHFGMIYMMNALENGCDFQQPLLSKNALKLLRLFSKGRNSIHLQLEVISRLNPTLAALPLEDGHDRKPQRKTLRKLGLEPLEFNAEPDLTAYQAAAERKKQNRRLLPPAQEQTRLSQENAQYNRELMSRFETVLKKVLVYQDGYYEELIGLDLYCAYWKLRQEWLTTHTRPKDYIFLYNKLCSMVDQIEILSDASDWSQLR